MAKQPRPMHKLHSEGVPQHEWMFDAHPYQLSPLPSPASPCLHLCDHSHIRRHGARLIKSEPHHFGSTLVTMRGSISSMKCKYCRLDYNSKGVLYHPNCYKGYKANLGKGRKSTDIIAEFTAIAAENLMRAAHDRLCQGKMPPWVCDRQIEARSLRRATINMRTIELAQQRMVMRGGMEHQPKFIRSPFCSRCRVLSNPTQARRVRPGSPGSCRCESNARFVVCFHLRSIPDCDVVVV